MRRSTLLLLAAVLATAAPPVPAADSLPQAPRRWVTDGAGFLSAGARDQLDQQLEAYEQRTGHQVLVWITPTSGNYTPEDFATKAFTAWKVGRANIDDGVVLFVFANDRKLRIEVGYGLESKVPDAVASRILRDRVVPRLQADDRDGAINDGVAALIAAIDGTAAPAASADAGSPTTAAPDDDRAGESPAPSLSTAQKIVIGLLIVGFIILLITNPSLALWLLFNLLSSGGGGSSSGGGGGGGFSGGGGRSGGGGASGSW